jgi:hypothetical protein
MLLKSLQSSVPMKSVSLCCVLGGGRQLQSSVQSVSLCRVLGGNNRNRLCLLGKVRGMDGSRQGERVVEGPT